MSSISKLLAQLIRNLAERRSRGLENVLRSTIQQLEALSDSVESSYTEKQLSLIQSDDDVG